MLFVALAHRLISFRLWSEWLFSVYFYLLSHLSVAEMVPFLLVNSEIRATTMDHFIMRARGIVSPFCTTIPSVRNNQDYGTPVDSFLNFLNSTCSVVSGVRAMHAMSAAFLGDAPLVLQIHIPSFSLPIWMQFLCAPDRYNMTRRYDKQFVAALKMWGGHARSVAEFEGLGPNAGVFCVVSIIYV